MNSWHVETMSIVRDEDAIGTCPLHCTMLGLGPLLRTPDPGYGSTPLLAAKADEIQNDEAVAASDPVYPTVKLSSAFVAL